MHASKKAHVVQLTLFSKNNLEAFNVESHIFAEKKELDSLHGDCNDDNGQIEIFTVLCSHSIKREISY